MAKDTGNFEDKSIRRLTDDAFKPAELKSLERAPRASGPVENPKQLKDQPFKAAELKSLKGIPRKNGPVESLEGVSREGVEAAQKAYPRNDLKHLGAFPGMHDQLCLPNDLDSLKGIPSKPSNEIDLTGLKKAKDCSQMVQTAPRGRVDKPKSPK